MANSQNLCLFTGNLGKDPEIRYSQSGTAVANLSIALSSRRKNGETWEDHTEWVNLVAFGKRAEVIRDYTRKGSKVRVETQVQTRKYQDQNGQDRYSTEFIINELELLTPKQEGPAQQQQYQPAPQAQRPAQQPAGAPHPLDDIDSEIPF